MQKYFKVIAVILLALNGIGAIFGGWNLITDPTGKSIQLPIEWMDKTVFGNFLIPGIILFTVNGLFNIFTALLVIMNKRKYHIYIMLSGIFLVTWLTVQIITIKLFYPPLHLTFYIIGLLLFISGFMLRKS
jgi:hypothetical protein